MSVRDEDNILQNMQGLSVRDDQEDAYSVAVSNNSDEQESKLSSGN